jgi:hypothetical protein
VVSDHPHLAVTDADGSFHVKEVPPGTYELSAWHERLAGRSRPVTVRAGEEGRVVLEMGL